MFVYDSFNDTDSNSDRTESNVGIVSEMNGKGCARKRSSRSRDLC
jgi:hypothetical protein